MAGLLVSTEVHCETIDFEFFSSCFMFQIAGDASGSKSIIQKDAFPKAQLIFYRRQNYNVKDISRNIDRSEKLVEVLSPTYGSLEIQ